MYIMTKVNKYTYIVNFEITDKYSEISQTTFKRYNKSWDTRFEKLPPCTCRVYTTWLTNIDIRKYNYNCIIKLNTLHRIDSFHASDVLLLTEKSEVSTHFNPVPQLMESSSQRG